MGEARRGIMLFAVSFRYFFSRCVSHCRHCFDIVYIVSVAIKTSIRLTLYKTKK